MGELDIYQYLLEQMKETHIRHVDAVAVCHLYVVKIPFPNDCHLSFRPSLGGSVRSRAAGSD